MTRNATIRSRTTLRAGLLALAVTVTAGLIGAPSPAHADRYDDWRREQYHEQWRDHEWREQEWRRHEWEREHAYRDRGYYAPGYAYAPPPPVVYGPPPSPGVSLFFPIR